MLVSPNNALYGRTGARVRFNSPSACTCFPRLNDDNQHHARSLSVSGFFTPRAVTHSGAVTQHLFADAFTCVACRAFPSVTRAGRYRLRLYAPLVQCCCISNLPLDMVGKEGGDASIPGWRHKVPGSGEVALPAWYLCQQTSTCHGTYPLHMFADHNATRNGLYTGIAAADNSLSFA